MEESHLSKHERQLISECLKGKPSAQRELYDRYAPKMFGVCLRYAKNFHLAEDLLQEGFVRVFRYLDKYRELGSFEGWMRRIFINISIEHFRKQNLLYPVGDVNERDTAPVDNDAMNNMAVKDLLKLVSELSNGYRMVFNMYVIEGFNHKEIGEMLGISEGTSKSQLARARAILKTRVTELYNDKYDAAIEQRL